MSSSGRPQGTDYRAATVQPDGTAVAAAAAGLELVRQRNTSGQQRFPDYASYLRYQRGRVEVQRRAALRAMIAGGSGGGGGDPPAPTVPDAPTSVSATAGNAEATVSFIAPLNNGGAAITGYTVTATPGGATASGASSPITVTGLTNGTAYTFTVVATNSVGDSLPSAASTSVTPTAPATGFIPTAWVDSNGVDFSTAGRAVAYGNGKWIAVGQDTSATIIMSDDNAITWNDVDNQIPSGIGGVFGIATDGAGKWVAVGNQNTAAGAKTILYSVDNGVTWKSNSAYNSGFNLPNGFTDRGWGVTYANGIWMAVGHYAQTPIQYERTIKIASTFDLSDGPNWIDAPSNYGNAPVKFGLSNPALCAAYGNGVWCVGGQDQQTSAANPAKSILYSTDNGASWNYATNTFRGQCSGIATDGCGNWVAVGVKRSGVGVTDLKPIKYSSNNGITWVDTTSADGNLFTSGTAVTYARTATGGVWVATGSGNSQTIIYSTDNGVTWSSAGINRFSNNGYGIAFSGDRWVAVGQAGTSSIKYSIS